MKLRDLIKLQGAGVTSMPYHGHPETSFYSYDEIAKQKGGVQAAPPVRADAADDAHHAADKKTADAIVKKHPDWSTDRVAHEMSEAEGGRGEFARFRRKAMRADSAGTQSEAPSPMKYAVVDGMNRELTRWPTYEQAKRASAGNAFSRIKPVDQRETQDKMLNKELRPQTRDAGVVMGSRTRHGKAVRIPGKVAARSAGKYGRM